MFAGPVLGSVYRGGAYDGYDRTVDRGGLGHPQVNHAVGATNVTASGAWLNGYLLATGSAATAVTVYWGDADGGTGKTAWAASVPFGVRNLDDRLTTNVVLAAHTRYYYRFYATNSAGEDGWGAESSTFLTPGPPVITTGYGAMPVSYATATLNGNFINGISATISLYWGTDTNAWSNTNNLGTRSQGLFARVITGLTPGTRYYYRCYGVNAYGGGWSETVAFTTTVQTLVFRGGFYDGYDRMFDRGDLGGPQVNNANGATNVTASGAWLNGTLVAAGSGSTTVKVYWGDADGGTNRTAWDTGVSFGVRSEGQSLTTNVLLDPYTPYYYRFYATNPAGEEAWAMATTVFTTPGIPQLDADPGAVPVSFTTASLNGNFTNGLSAAITIYWGVDTNAWDHSISLGTRAQGAFVRNISGLAEGTRYYYRCHGLNDYGEGWSGTVTFTTRVYSVVSFLGGPYDGYDQSADRMALPEQAAGSLFMFR